jgi:hypothetical protein
MSYTIVANDTLYTLIKAKHQDWSKKQILDEAEKVAEANKESTYTVQASWGTDYRLKKGKVLTGSIFGAEETKNAAPVQNKTDNAVANSNAQKANDFNTWCNGTQDKAFEFAPEYRNNFDKTKKFDKDLYKKGALDFGKSIVSRYDTNHDGKISYDEMEALEISDAKKENPQSTEADVKSQSKLMWKAMNTNSDKYISANEAAAFVVSMDMNAEGEIDGKIDKKDNYMGVMTALGDEKYTDKLKAKFTSLQKFLFGSIDKTEN